MIVQHHIEETNQRRLARGVARKLMTVDAQKKKNPSSVSYMLRSVACICYIFIHKISFYVNICKHSMAQFTPEAMVKAILEEPRARTLMEKLICETVSPKVRSTYIGNVVTLDQLFNLVRFNKLPLNGFFTKFDTILPLGYSSVWSHSSGKQLTWNNADNCHSFTHIVPSQAKRKRKLKKCKLYRNLFELSWMRFIVYKQRS